MLDRDQQARLLRRYRGIVSGALLVFFAWAYYQAFNKLILWTANQLNFSGPGIENMAMLLALPCLAAVWFSHCWVMDRLDKAE